MTKTTVTRGQTGHVSLGKAGDYTCEEQVNIRLYIYIYIYVYMYVYLYKEIYVTYRSGRKREQD